VKNARLVFVALLATTAGAPFLMKEVAAARGMSPWASG
jgi:hypothetical protein